MCDPHHSKINPADAHFCKEVNVKNSTLLTALKEQLVFFENGGYGHTFRSGWRPTLLLRDSPLCLNAMFPGTRSCRECILLNLIPIEKRGCLLPCHQIPIDEAGVTIAKLYDEGTPERLDRTFHDWLCATIRQLEAKDVD
jgi:hypothetical protein